MAGIIETALIGSKVAILASTVGTDILIKTVTNTTSSIVSMTGYLMTSSQPGINEIVSTLKKIDLEFTVGIIEELVKEQEGKELEESVKKAMIGVNETLGLINQELDSMKQAIEYHNTKYFNGWRSFSWTGNVNNIKDHNEILKNRYMILFELLKIKGYK